MKFIALEIETERAAADAFTPHLESEARTLWTLLQRGFVREAYFRADRHTAVLILECDDAAEADRVLGELPLVRERLIHFDVIPLVPYSGFERLFAR